MKSSVLKFYPQNLKEEDARVSSQNAAVSLIRPELVTLTGNHFRAVVLNQLLYWTQRVRDFDLMLQEEKMHYQGHNNSPRYGWIYKTARELIKDTMLCVDRTTIRRYLNFLIEKEWVFERAHPSNRWDKTTQYRVNLKKIQQDLLTLGQSLPGAYAEEVFSKVTEDSSRQNNHSSEYSTPSRGQIALSSEQASLKTAETSNGQNNPSNGYNAPSSGQNALLSEQASLKTAETSNGQNNPSSGYNAPSNGQNALSNGHNALSRVQNAPSNTEIITENKNREHAQRTRAREGEKFFIQEKVSNPENPECILEKMLDLWKRNVGHDVTLTRERKRQLHSILSLHFQSDMQQWEQFCERIKGAPFLMGEGGRRWHVTLDWILNEANLCKVLEGNFDNPESLDLKKSESTKASQDQERADILSSVQDSTWQDWCTQLSCQHQQKSLVSLFVLKEIASARFVEFDGRLVWIESKDPKTLSRINDLRLQLLPIVQRSFPETRNIRTQMREVIPPSSLPAFKNDSIILTTSTHPGESYAQ